MMAGFGNIPNTLSTGCWGREFLNFVTKISYISLG